MEYDATYNGNAFYSYQNLGRHVSDVPISITIKHNYVRTKDQHLPSKQSMIGTRGVLCM